MYLIKKKRVLHDSIFLMDIVAPRVAKYCQPGQFVIVRIDELGERIPLTVCDYDREEGTVTIVVQTVGASTMRMKELNEGEYLHDFVGPLGKPSEFITDDLEEVKKKKILFVAGGLGTAPVYPQVKWLHENGIDADVIVGAKNKELIILEEEMKAVAGNLYITTDDGSYVRKGLVTEVIADLVEKEGKKYDVCVAIGPMIMMKFWMLTAFLSIALGVMNLLPIPALDGGHAVIAIWEMITRKKPSDKFLERVQMVGFWLIIALMVFATWNDILRLLHINL